MCFRQNYPLIVTINHPLQGVEVCEDQVVDQLLRGRVNAAPALQHHANHQVLDQLDQEDGGEGKEAVGQVQGSRGGCDPPPGHHALHCQEVCLRLSKHERESKVG